jgi:hypothetical protein
MFYAVLLYEQMSITAEKQHHTAKICAHGLFFPDKPGSIRAADKRNSPFRQPQSKEYQIPDNYRVSRLRSCAITPERATEAGRIHI